MAESTRREDLKTGEEYHEETGVLSKGPRLTFFTRGAQLEYTGSNFEFLFQPLPGQFHRFFSLYLIS